MALTVNSLALNIEDELKNVFGTPVNAQSLEDFADAIAKAIIDELITNAVIPAGALLDSTSSPVTGTTTIT